MPASIAQFADNVRQVYRDAIAGQGSRVLGGTNLWSQFEAIVGACQAGANCRQLTEKVNEIAVAKILLDDPHLTGLLQYEPDILPSNRRIDFVATRANDYLYVEVKTVHPRTEDSLTAWNRFVDLRQHHPVNVEFILEKEAMGGAIYGNTFASRSKFLEYTLDFESRLQEAKSFQGGPGVLVFCGTGFAWRLSDLEDFADFYRLGNHRADDPFSIMEEHYMCENQIVLLRNIDCVAYFRRPIEMPLPTEFKASVRGPRFGT